MTPVGIEAMNVFGGTAYVDVAELARHRNLDRARFDNLLMRQKSVALLHEDPVTFGVNAAKPVIDTLSPEEKGRIELVITCTESGIDFGKSVSTYVHHHLGLSRNCRLFEIKQACYSGTAGLQSAVAFVQSGNSPGAKALVIATDIARFIPAEGGSMMKQDWTFVEPSAGAGAVAMLVGERPDVFQVDAGASGYYGYEVMDTCRPVPDGEAGDSDLSLLSYLDCCENSFLEYCKRVGDVNYRDTFQYLAFHTPFGGMVKGAHRTMMRRTVGATPDEIESDFKHRVLPGTSYCERVGNIMGGSVFMALAGIVDASPISAPSRVGCFSYGSGCCSEFYSGVVTPDGQVRQRRFAIGSRLDKRYRLSMEEYDAILRAGTNVRFGTRNVELDWDSTDARRSGGMGERLALRAIKNFHREYEWVS